MYMYMYMYTYIHTYIHPCIHTYIHTYIHVCVCVRVRMRCGFGGRFSVVLLLSICIRYRLELRVYRVLASCTEFQPFVEARRLGVLSFIP